MTLLVEPFEIKLYVYGGVFSPQILRDVHVKKKIFHSRTGCIKFSRFIFHVGKYSWMIACSCTVVKLSWVRTVGYT